MLIGPARQGQRGPSQQPTSALLRCCLNCTTQRTATVNHPVVLQHSCAPAHNTVMHTCLSNVWLTLHRQASQSNRDPYLSQSQAAPQPGSARGAQMAQKRPWKPSMGLVPSSQTGSMPPRPATNSGVCRLARPADAQTASQPGISFSQPNSFQDYTPTGTPDRQYIMPGNQNIILSQTQTHRDMCF